MPKIDEALSRIYADLECELPDADLCNVCGDCCDFKSYEHQLRLTHVELQFLISHHGLRRPKSDGICPYLSGGHCVAREGRALGCRIFFCKADRSVIQNVYEIYLTKIREAIGADTGVYYGELIESLKIVRIIN